MGKFLKYLVFGMLILLVGIAIGFHVPPVAEETVSVKYSAKPNSIWEKAGLPVTTETSPSIGEELEKKGYLKKIENSGNYDYVWTLEKVND